MHPLSGWLRISLESDALLGYALIPTNSCDTMVRGKLHTQVVCRGYGLCTIDPWSAQDDVEGRRRINDIKREQQSLVLWVVTDRDSQGNRSQRTNDFSSKPG